MNAGLPVLSVDFPEMRQIILEEECGILIYDQSVKSIIDAIEMLLANPENLSKMRETASELYASDIPGKSWKENSF